MRKIKYLIYTLLLVLLLPISVNAASGKISIASASTIVVGNTVTVTVNISSGTGIGSWEVELGYDKNYLQMTSSTAEAGGSLMVGYTNSTSGTKTKSYTYKFKTKKTGSTTLKIDSYDVYANDFSSMSMSTTGKTIKIITQEELEASYSKNNDLESLAIDGVEITPAFNKDTLEYSAVVPENTKQVNITAKASDSKSSVSGVGTHEVTNGTNTFEIVVKAENGSEKTYKINVEVKDSNPINVKIGSNEYTVVKISDNLPSAPLYEATTVKINDFEIPAYKNSNTNLVLVGLKNSKGEIGLYIYDEATNSYSTYHELGVNKITIYPLETDEELSGYTKGEIEINNTKVNGYYFDKSSRFVVIYGVNVETGEKGFYLYDKEDQSIIKYDDEYVSTLEKKINTYSYIIIGLGAFIVLLLLILLFRKPKKRKKKEFTVVENKEKMPLENEIIEEISNSNDLESEEEQIITDNIIEENKEDDEMEDLFNKGKKKKSKKH